MGSPGYKIMFERLDQLLSEATPETARAVCIEAVTDFRDFANALLRVLSDKDGFEARLPGANSAK